MDADLISTKQAAELLGISRTTLTRRVAAGWLRPALVVPGYRGDFYFDRAAVEAKRARIPGPSGTAPKGESA